MAGRHLAKAFCKKGGGNGFPEVFRQPLSQCSTQHQARTQRPVKDAGAGVSHVEHQEGIHADQYIQDPVSQWDQDGKGEQNPEQP
ncbi:MAG: hypothetical protein CW342_03185 [Thermoactinomycetaceae bacterium]|nr:hypothetical protein [Bacillota bacterium]MBO2531894.1 hypothetical protein [Thermoactinomycetaceae bacterium]